MTEQKNSKIALVTGASRGIGATIALELAKNNIFVVGTATSDQGEIIIDKVTTLAITTLHPKQIGTFSSEPQLVNFQLELTASKLGQDATEYITKSYDFIARAKNVSMLP